MLLCDNSHDSGLGYFPTITSDRASTSPDPSFLFYDIVVIFQINGIKGEK